MGSLQLDDVGRVEGVLPVPLLSRPDVPHRRHPLHLLRMKSGKSNLALTFFLCCFHFLFAQPVRSKIDLAPVDKQPSGGAIELNHLYTDKWKPTRKEITWLLSILFAGLDGITGDRPPFSLLSLLSPAPSIASLRLSFNPSPSVTHDSILISSPPSSPSSPFTFRRLLSQLLKRNGGASAEH
jgi:hypothetical protein